MQRGKIYPRRTNSRKEKPLVLIVPEGTETEKLYFQHFNSREKQVRVEVIENTAKGAKTDAVILNSAAAIHIAKPEVSINDAINIAKEVIDSGKALKQLESYVKLSNEE